MFTARPLFSLALSVLFGELLFCLEIPLSLRFILLLSYLFYLKLILQKKKQILLLLSLFLFFFSSLHFQLALSRFERQQRAIEQLLPFRCALKGTIYYISENEKNYKLSLENCLLDSSFGAIPKNLNEEQSKKWKARNHLSFQKIQVYLKKSETAEGKGEAKDDIAAKPPFYPGETILLHGKCLEIHSAMNEGEFSFLQYAKGEGIEAIFLAENSKTIASDSSPFLKLLYEIRWRISKDLEHLYPDPEPTDLSSVSSPMNQSAFLKSLLLGEKSTLPEEERSLYQEAGIGHILAVSGLHLSLVGGACFSLLRFSGMEISSASLLSSFFILSYALFTGASGSTLRAAIMLFISLLGKCIGRGQDRISSLSLAISLLLSFHPLYLYSSGFQCSFFTLFLLLLLSERDGKEERKLLSKKWEKAVKKRKFQSLILLLPKKCLEASKTLFLFYLGLFPIFAILQYSFPTFAPLLNLLLLPLLPFFFLLGFLSVLFLHLPSVAFLSGFFAHALSVLLTFFHRLIEISLQLPYSSILLGKMKLSSLFFYLFFYYVLFLFPFKRRLKFFQVTACSHRTNNPIPFFIILDLPIFKKNLRKIRILSYLLFLLLVPFFLPIPSRKLEITALYVGQGDGFLIQKGNFVFTIDNGSSSDKHFGKNTLIPYCKAKRIRRIRYALITHSDIDHTSGIQRILEENPASTDTSFYSSENRLQIENLILPIQAREDRRYDILKRLALRHGAKLLYWKNGDVYSEDSSPSKILQAMHSLHVMNHKEEEKTSLSLHCYYPVSDLPMEEANAHSIGCILRYGNFSMVFTGDMPAEAEKEMLSAIKKEGQSPSVDIVKLAHHGSKTSSSPLFLSETKGKFALFSYGKKNRYGHPHKITLEKCNSFGLIPLETAKLGEILIRTDGEDYQIITPCTPP